MKLHSTTLSKVSVDWFVFLPSCMKRPWHIWDKFSSDTESKFYKDRPSSMTTSTEFGNMGIFPRQCGRTHANKVTKIDTKWLCSVRGRGKEGVQTWSGRVVGRVLCHSCGRGTINHVHLYISFIHLSCFSTWKKGLRKLTSEMEISF